MSVYRRKGTATSAIVGVLAVLVVGGAIWYFASDPFRTRVNESVKQGTQWTPENIAADPKNYLNYVEAETEKAIQSLKASKIAVAQNRAKLTQMRDDAQAQVTTGTKAVSELIEKYKTADSSNVWPVSFNAQSLDKEKTKVTVVSLNKDLVRQKTRLTQVNDGLARLDVQDSKIDEAMANANNQLAEVKTNRGLLEVQNLTADLKDKLVSMNAAMTNVVGAASANNGVVSLEQLTAQSATTADNTEFDKILASNPK